jgi:hypothetical protein
MFRTWALPMQRVFRISEPLAGLITWTWPLCTLANAFLAVRHSWRRIRAVQLERSLAEMEQDVHQSHEPNAPRAAGPEQCRYCRAREVCPTRLDWLSIALPVVAPVLPMVSARDWTPAQRVLFLEREKDARKWLEVRKGEIKALLAESPDAAPGYGLKPGRALETVANIQEVYNRFCHDLGGTMGAFMHCLKLEKMALKAQVRTLIHHNGQALEDAMDALLAGCLQSKTSEPTIERLKGLPTRHPGLTASTDKRFPDSMVGAIQSAASGNKK